MNLNRASQPEISSIETINIPELKMITAPNGVEIYILNMGDQDVSRIDLMFSAGKWEQDKKLVAMFTNLLLKEGAGKYSSSQLAEMLDYYGAWLQPSATFHNSYMTLYSLNKHIKNTLPLLEMIIKNPLFEEKEFEIMVQRRKQQFCIEDEKVNVQAYNKFVEQLYGEDHPYGQYAVKEDFDKLNINDIKSFHTKY